MRQKDLVLVVEDNAIDRRVLCHILEDEFCVIQAEGGQQALVTLKQNHTIAAVLLDLIMPAPDGFSVLQAMRSTPALAGIPVLISTSSSDRATEMRALALGASDFIAKPYDPAITKLRLRHAIALSQQKAVQELEYLALFDPLTGLYNERHFFSETRRMVATYTDKTFHFVQFDIDRFRLANTLFGSSAGNRLLCNAARAMCDALQDVFPCTYGRLQGDLFCFCLPDDGVQNLLNRFSKIQKELSAFNQQFYVKPSFGVSALQGAHASVEMAAFQASLAAQECKEQYRKIYSFFREDLAVDMMDSQQLTSDITAALAENQFLLYYQPRVDVATGCVNGAEALVRWQHPRRGLLPPGDFLPLFERNGFVAELDVLIWGMACRQLRTWLDAGLHPCPISVNISRVSMYVPQLIDTLSALTKTYHLPRKLLQLEITENTYIDDAQNAIRRLNQLHDLGFTILMDDFGSGYSSLNMLKDMPVDVLKLDMGFLSGAALSPRSEIILDSILSMARRLKIQVIAEGVESPEQFSLYRRLGCDAVQGYYFSRPVIAKVFEATLGRPLAPTAQFSTAPSEPCADRRALQFAKD